MPFDLSSAKPVDADNGGFDLASAKPVGSPPQGAAADADAETPGRLDRAKGAYREALGAVGEPIAAMGSSMLAKPVSDIAGLGAIPLHAMGAIATDPTEVKRKVQEGMTYEPRTEAGKAVTKYNPLALIGRAVGAGAESAGRAVAGDDPGPVRAALGHATTEGLEQLPAFAGLKAPAGAAAVGSGLKTAARDTMQSALKPTLAAQRTGKAAAGIDTLLDEGINVTRGGAEKLQTRISALNDSIAERIENSPATIDKIAVAERLRPVIDKFAKQVNMLDDVRAIQKAYEEFMDHPLLAGDKIPVKTAQELKQGTYRALGDKAYGELKSSSIEAQKALARGLKEEIADAVPDVRKLNADESKLLNGLSLVERRVLMEANKNPVGLGWLTTSPTKFAAYMADRSGLFKSLVARMLNTASEAMPSIGAMGPVGGMVTANQAGIQPPPQ